jgi:LacI family transcriptional regulator
MSPATPETRKAPVRMKDIARDLGLSVVTVSKVFRGHHDIGEETRRRVLERIKELNYQPNLAARSLATGRSFFMGLVVPDLVHPFFSEVAKYLAGVIRGSGYTLLISASQEDTRLEQTEIDYLRSRRVDVLLVASSHSSPEAVAALAEGEAPLILVDRQFEGVRANFVGVDDELVGRMATEHLIAQGCRHIALISAASSTARSRMAGYQQALASAGLAHDPQLVVTRPHGDDAADETGYALMKQLLATGPRPDAVFCHNDPTAMGAIQAILDAGLRIPQDIAVAGCGNVRYAHCLRVPLTSVDQNCQGIGEEAGRLALQLTGKPARRPRTILMEPRLVVRESSLRKS